MNKKTQAAMDASGCIEGLVYDANGNLVKSGCTFDPFDQLISSDTEHYGYDALSRRLSKRATSYLYVGDEEIGAFETGCVKELKIVGDKNIVAIERGQKVFAPIQDVQGTIRALIDWETQERVQENACDAFGGGLTDAIPYAYAGKRFDPETGLLYFGKRYYEKFS